MEHKAENERIIYEDPDPNVGYILAPDLKWSGVNVDNLYVQAIVRKNGIKSIRSLTAEHLPLLKNIYITGCVSYEKLGLLKRYSFFSFFATFNFFVESY